MVKVSVSIPDERGYSGQLRGSSRGCQRRLSPKCFYGEFKWLLRGFDQGEYKKMLGGGISKISMVKVRVLYTVNGAIVVNFAVAVGGVREDKSANVFMASSKGY